ncbi:hypothetical protein GCM10011402_29740 [Paracoccus acridae]|uniref:Uncharacterized protein n=1 Tax=Paracoccus acridae TaxID=1795310 RepID=A0ABQ1VL98_9RHOB|nr:hypothetical protein GCM10011402_29740 [Paracoccus acridae]
MGSDKGSRFSARGNQATARLRQQGKGDKSTLPVRDNSTLRLQLFRHLTGVMEQPYEL